MVSDPFSDILSLTQARSLVTGGFTAGARWSVRFHPSGRAKFFGIVRGSCWLCMEGREPVHLGEGDVFLTSAERPYALSSGTDVPPVDSKVAFAGQDGVMRALGEGDECLVIGGHVELDPARGNILRDVLPPLIHVRADMPEAAVTRWLLGQLVAERENDSPGAAFASAQLAQLMLVQVLRVHLATGGPLDTGLLRAINDPRIAPALRLMHAEPGRAWQLPELAKATAMSRTTFAEYFKTVAGMPPLAYLAQWRMRLAERSLREENTPISRIAQSLGYGTESAFSHAFKRITGMAPGQYRKTSPGVRVIGDEPDQ
ncbi:AraC family transcriptional regulator [Pinirhizobacter soli]|uniref:AraC family transcriptional regulator n=1 Tax=Pinirhizobacter soli TaxID=2786953 RepID=UPI00202A4297|nr:AraC family transcriptional regulator [Pinirhizobacter soli]